MTEILFRNVASYALNAAWLTPVLGAAVWCLARCFRRAGLELQHKLWVAALLLAILLPANPLRLLSVSPEAKLGAGSISGSALFAYVPSVDVAETGSGLILPPLIIHIISALYLASLLFFIVRLGWAIRGTAALLGRARPVFTSTSPESDITALWIRATETFSTSDSVLMRSTEIRTPVTAGFYRQVLLPDTLIEDHSPTEFLAALGHECAHVQRRDFGKNVFYEIASLFTAFHPATWFIKSQIAQTREMICDQMAAERLLDRRSYAQALLQLASKVPQAEPNAVLAMGIFDTNILERRIMTLTTSKTAASRARRYGSGLIATVLLAAFAGGAGLLAQSVATESSALVNFLGDRLGRVDLACTFYGYTNNIWGPSAGTCWLDMKDKKAYVCYRNDHPEQNQSQRVCEWKVQRAQAAGN